MVRLLNRSSIDTIPSQFIARNLSTSIQLFEKQDNQKESSESNKSAPEKSSSDDIKESGSSQNNNDDKKKKNKKTVDDKDRENNTNKAIAYLTKAILWICLIYSISFTIIVVTSILSGGGVGGGNGKKGDSENYTVSWKEFVQYMLASGEVKEVIIRPQYEYVRIILHDGAVINGRRPRFSSYMLTVPNIERFEQRLREVERSMGIAEGIVTKVFTENNYFSAKLILLKIFLSIQECQSDTNAFLSSI